RTIATTGEHDADGDKQQCAAHADRRPDNEQPLVEDEPQRPGHERQDDRKHREMLLHHHGSGSAPSTWSVPLNPRAAINTTSRSAVVAKLMTIAVSTSACGSGSA